MNYHELASDLPLSGRISFSSPEENEEVMQRYGINQQVRQLGKGGFRAECAMLDTRHAILTADRFDQACSVYLEPPPGMVVFLMFRSAGRQVLASGETVANENLVVLPDGSGTDVVSPELAGSDAVILPVSRYSELMEVLCPRCERSNELAVFNGDTQQLHVIRDGLLNAMQGPGFDENDEIIPNMVAQMISWIGQSYPGSRPEHIHRKQSRIHIAKQVQAYIEEYYRETVVIEDLCRVTRKEARTLQRCFKQYFGITITDYLKMARLNAAHRALASAHPKEKNVALIATQNGFNHIGRFSVEYRRHFGESPSETLSLRSN
jgi:AraC-like DNA-binding protein